MRTAIKNALGRLPLPDPPIDFLVNSITANRLPVITAHRRLAAYAIRVIDA